MFKLKNQVVFFTFKICFEINLVILLTWNRIRIYKILWIRIRIQPIRIRITVFNLRPCVAVKKTCIFCRSIFCLSTYFFVRPIPFWSVCLFLYLSLTLVTPCPCFQYKEQTEYIIKRIRKSRQKKTKIRLFWYVCLFPYLSLTLVTDCLVFHIRNKQNALLSV